ncbi:MAG: DbpA RNA binding domain-containing protein, partial [Acidobacteria bacterium]|nr:DbpA RNA binding domain-containing protein [Acidobacteriota bacterium]
ANISGKEIGPIEIQDDRSIVYVPADKKDQVIEAMRGAMFKGTALDVRPEGEAGSPAGPSRRPRKASGSDFRSPARPPVRDTRGAPARDTRGAPARDTRGAPARLPFGRPAAAKPRSRFASDEEAPSSRTTRAKFEKTPHRGKGKPAGRYEKPAPAGAPPGKRGFYSDFVGGKKKSGPGKPGGKGPGGKKKGR